MTLSEGGVAKRGESRGFTRIPFSKAGGPFPLDPRRPDSRWASGWVRAHLKPTSVGLQAA